MRQVNTWKIAGEDEGVQSSWSAFSDPISLRRDKLQKTRFQEPTIIDLVDVDLTLEDFDSVPGLKLEEFKFPFPRSFNDCNTLIRSCLSVNAMCRRTAHDLRHNPKWSLDEKQFKDLNNLRFSIQSILYTTLNNQFLAKPIDFTIGMKDVRRRLDTSLFTTYLQVVRCIYLDQTKHSKIAEVTCNHHSFAPLHRIKILHPFLDPNKKISEYDGKDLLQAVVFIERSLTRCEYDPSISVFIDLLVSRLSFLILETQNFNMYIPDQAARVDPNSKQPTYRSNQKTIEDFCWAIYPFYKRLALRVTLAENICPPAFEITNLEAESLLTMLRQYSRDSGRATLQPIFMTYIFNSIVSEGEHLKMARDHPFENPSNGKILELLRPKGDKRQLLGILSQTPWQILEKKLLPQNELDILLMLIWNDYMGTFVHSDLKWSDYFLHTNYELGFHSDPVSFITRDYPVIIQHFNNFGVFNHGSLIELPSGMHCVLYWLSLIFLEHNGRLTREDKNFNFEKLGTIIPESVKKMRLEQLEARRLERKKLNLNFVPPRK